MGPPAQLEMTRIHVAAGHGSTFLGVMSIMYGT